MLTGLELVIEKSWSICSVYILCTICSVLLHYNRLCECVGYMSDWILKQNWDHSRLFFPPLFYKSLKLHCVVRWIVFRQDGINNSYITSIIMKHFPESPTVAHLDTLHTLPCSLWHLLPLPPHTLSFSHTLNHNSHTHACMHTHTATLIRHLWSSQHCRHTFREFRWWMVEGMKPDQKGLVLFDKMDFEFNLIRHLDEALSKFCAHCNVHVLGVDLTQWL